jgi:hypothetical protein
MTDTTDGEETVVDTAADTASGPQIAAQAWSMGEQPTTITPYQEPEHHSWVALAKWAAAVTGVGAVIGAALMLMSGLTTTTTTTTVTTTVTASPVTVTEPPVTITAQPAYQMPAGFPSYTPPPTMPEGPACGVDRCANDRTFLARLRSTPGFVVLDPARLVWWGRHACLWEYGGLSDAAAAAKLVEEGINAPAAATIARTTRTVYGCGGIPTRGEN